MFTIDYNPDACEYTLISKGQRIEGLTAKGTARLVVAMVFPNTDQAEFDRLVAEMVDLITHVQPDRPPPWHLSFSEDRRVRFSSAYKVE